ncbi:MAG: DM13 domain-containing protein [Pseudomonadota bacterium]
MPLSKSVTIVAPALIALTLGACSYVSNNAGETGSQPATVETVSLENASSISAGTFEGRSDHVTTGGVSVVQTASGYQLVFAEDFSLDGAPDPVVGFGNNGEYDVASQVDSLSNKTGAQSYALPATFTPSDYSEVYVWCEQFAVPLGVATLESAE